MASAPIVRFAPSPTGRLHVGNVRAALLNWLFARRHDGCFILRLDDTDRERSTREFAEGIADDLVWLGLGWDRLEHQSARFARYDRARDLLIAAGRLYACYETPQELEFKRKRQMAQGRPPVYDRAALRLTDADRARLQAEGRAPHWRFRLEPGDVRWTDMVRGEQHIDESSQSDPVLIRADGTYLYTLPSVVDDIDFAVSHVIRGEDHVTNTGTQIQLFTALGATPPAFGHFPLLTDAQGGGLSKRAGSLAVQELREQGIEALAIAALLARLGTSHAIEPVSALTPLIETVDLGHVGRAAARFSLDELRTLSARTVHGLPYDAVRPRLQALDADFGEAFWLAVRGNIATVFDARIWADVVRGPITPVLEDAPLLAAAARSLPPEPWNGGTWKAWSAAVGAAAGKKGRALFHPLRLALTGREQGPEMAGMLPLIGRAKVLSRLRGDVS
ncbi:MAG: glutamate--tRNA ligase [Alphaproteobacteria bacterium]|nr:glutamate--tRNA ligase [Alphaproteobacteria bacterium]MCW5742649.1 glutamate--tRNA ligase [Alphaproteobacteria bacterium]